MWKILPLTLVACLPLTAQEPVPQLWTPADSVRAAAQDIRKQIPGHREQIRYLDIGHIARKDRPELIQTLAGHVNSLSTEPDLVPPFVLPGTDGAVLRVNFRDYGWRCLIWERLADADPYYSLDVGGTEVVSWGGGTYHDGLPYADKAFTWKRPKRALAPWLSEGPNGKALLQELVGYTNSRIPIVRGDWFLWQTSVQEGRVPGYYDFLGIADQKDYERVIRFDPKLARKTEYRRVVISSGIALQPRRIERINTVLGGLWRTGDVELGQGNKNARRVLDDAFQADATRQIAPLLNGMAVFLLADGKGKRQNKAPDQIVGGYKFGGGNDTRLHIYYTCLSCHLQAKDEDMLKSLGNKKILKVGAIDYAKEQELKRQYLRSLETDMRHDRERYATRITEATGGMTPQQFGTAIARWYGFRDDAKVDMTWAARDMAMPVDVVKVKWRGVDKLGLLDPLLADILNGESIGIRQWEEVWPQAMVAARGYVLPQKAKVGAK